MCSRITRFTLGLFVNPAASSPVSSSLKLTRPVWWFLSQLRSGCFPRGCRNLSGAQAVVTPAANNELAMHMVVWYYYKLVQDDTRDILEPAASSSSTTTTTTTTPEVSESLLRTYVQDKFNKLVEEDGDR